MTPLTSEKGESTSSREEPLKPLQYNSNIAVQFKFELEILSHFKQLLSDFVADSKRL